MKNHYQTLGVTKTASPDEIKRAYRKLASQHHPDKGGDTGRFQEIEEAYRVLSDPNQRAAYDNPQPGPHSFNFNTGGFDFQTIFDMFGTNMRPQHRRQQVARMSLWISLEDVAKGGRRQVAVGTAQGTQGVEIEIPLGIGDGETVQYQGLAPGGLDLLVTFRVQQSGGWSRQGQTLMTERQLSIWDLVLGTEITIQDLLGNSFVLNVPPGTQPGTLLRMRGRGLPAVNRPPGDILVRIQARVPDKISTDLTDAIRRERGH